MDEMHVKEDLVYNKHTGDLVGFMNLGEMNTHLINLYRAAEEGQSKKIRPLAMWLWSGDCFHLYDFFMPNFHAQT